MVFSRRNPFPPGLLLVVTAIVLGPHSLAFGQAQNASVGFVTVDLIGDDNKPTQVTGSCIHVLPGGWLITNRHVAPGQNFTANTIQVTFRDADRKHVSFPAKLHAVHPDRDLALLQCQLPAWPTMQLGRTAQVRETDKASCVGYPLGRKIQPDAASPDVSISTGTITSLRHDESGQLCWLDTDAAVTNGNSGGALLDAQGKLIGVLTQSYAGFGRAIPVEYVQELLGQVAMSVQARCSDDSLIVRVTPTALVKRLRTGTIDVHIGGKLHNSKRLAAEKGGLETAYALPAIDANASATELVSLSVNVADTNGQQFTHRLFVPRRSVACVPVRGTVHWVQLTDKKANNWHWDSPFAGPDIFYRIYVDGVVVVTSKPVFDQFRALDATGFDCRANSEISIKVYDKDLEHDDYAGEIRFTADGAAVQEIKTASGQVRSCLIRLQPVPPRVTSK